MNTKLKLIHIFFLGGFTFLSIDAVVLEQDIIKPFPAVGVSMYGNSGVGNADNPQFIGRNPAIISNIYSQTLIIDNYTNKNDFNGLYTGYFSTIGRWAFGVGSTMVAPPSNRNNFTSSNYQFSGAAFTIGTPIWKTLQTGLSFYYNKPLSTSPTTQYGIQVGFLHLVDTNIKSFFGVHQFNFGINLEIEYNYIEGSGVVWRVGPTPGLSLRFIDHDLVKFNFFLDFPFQPNFVNFPTNFGFDLTLYRMFKFTLGSSSSDFFKMNTMHYGFGYTYRDKNFSMDIGSVQLATLGSEINLKDIRYRANFSMMIRYHHDRVTLDDDNSDNRTEYSFSPNNDGIQDSISIKLPKSLLENTIDWSFSIKDATSKTVFLAENKFHKANELKKKPDNLLWDGTNSKGKVLADGVYNGSLYILKKNGKLLQLDLAKITIDTSPPKALFENDAFNYDLTFHRQPMKFTLKALPEEFEEAQFEILNSNSTTIKADYCTNLQLPCKFKWWPRNSKNLKSGTYYPVVNIKDLSGNRSQLKGKPIRVSYGKEPFVIIFQKMKLTSKELFTKGLKIKIINKVKYRFGRVRLEIFNELGERIHKIKLIRNRKRRTLQTIWKGQGLPKNFNGVLSFRLRHFVKEKDVILATESILLDSVKPRIEFAVTPNHHFIPGFSQTNVIYFKSKIYEKNRIKSWKLIVKDKRFKKIKFTTSGINQAPAPILPWNGLEGEESPLLSETDYLAQLKVTDEVGNVGLSNEVKFRTGLRLDSDPPTDKSILVGGRQMNLGVKNTFRISLPNINFLPNSAQPSAGSMKVLREKIFPVLKKLNNFSLRIEGHIHNIFKDKDPQGIDPKGIEFSYQRAKKIMQIFLQQGMDPSNITAVGLGATRPIAKNSSPSEIAKNRRVEIILIRKTNDNEEL